MISVFDYKSKDAYLLSFGLVGIVALISSAVDFAGGIVGYGNASLYWYGFFYRLVALVIYSILSIKAYYYYRYLSLMFWLTGLPTIFWSILIFYKIMSLWLFVVTVVLYAFIVWMFISRSLDKKFDYTRAAKKLLKDYPEPITVKYNNLLEESEKTNKDGDDVGSKVLATIFSIIPPWGLFAFPIIFVNIISQFLGLDGLAIGVTTSGLFLVIMLAGYSTFHWRYKEVFERAEELLAEKNLTSKE